MTSEWQIYQVSHLGQLHSQSNSLYSTIFFQVATLALPSQAVLFHPCQLLPLLVKNLECLQDPSHALPPLRSPP